MARVTTAPMYAEPVPREESRRTSKPNFDPHPEYDAGYSQLPEAVWLDEVVSPEGALPDRWGFDAERRQADAEREGREADRESASRSFRVSERMVTKGQAPLFGDEEE